MKIGVDYRRWAEACRALNADEDRARTFRTQRYAFTHALAELLVKDLPPAGDDQVIYAVHLSGRHPRPVYLGTSSEGRRRLWDLPVGESHHLSNTYPPEIWESVQVLHWKRVLTEHGHDLAGLQKAVGEQFNASPAEALKLIGMSIEFLFQKAVRPEINIRTKLRQGGFKEVDFSESKSRQAQIAHRRLDPAFNDLTQAWSNLGKEARDCDKTIHSGRFGSVIFPSRVFG